VADPGDSSASTDGRDPRVRDLEIEQAQLRGFAHSFSEVEWLLLILVMLFLFVTRPDSARDPYVVGILVAFAAFILVFRYAKVFATRTATKIGVEILVMVAFLTGVLATSGPEARVLVNLYLLPVITAALALGKRATLLVMALVIGCYILLPTLDGGADALSPRLASEVAGVLGPMLLVAFLTTLLAENIHTAKARIRALSDRDELTGLYNVRAFTKLAERQHELAARAGDVYSIVMVDVRGLRSVNEIYGHEAGNQVLHLAGDALLRLTRGTDVVARYGGDEFAILLTHVDNEIAAEVAQRIRNVVFATTLEVAGRILRVQVAVGVAAYPMHGGSVQQVIAAADRAVLKDKAGREKPKGRLIIEKR
jgi:diguanylate cyclase (GGDEF)-like protein